MYTLRTQIARLTVSMNIYKGLCMSIINSQRAFVAYGVAGAHPVLNKCTHTYALVINSKIAMNVFVP
jgi:hypothetical protein